MAPKGPIVFLLDEARESEFRSVRLMIDPALVAVLTQVRRTLEIIDLVALEDSILTKGQINPGIIAALPPCEAARYVADINGIWQSEHLLDDFTPLLIDGEVYYCFLVAGHRRLHACRSLVRKFATGDEVATNAFDGRYRGEMRFGLTAERAIELQFQENIFKPPPPAEEAHAAWCFWRWRKVREPDLSLAQFARDIGKSDGWVRGALRFAELPETIQAFAHGRSFHGGQVVLPYGMLVEVARLQEGYRTLNGREPLTDLELERWLYRYGIAMRMSVADFGAMVSQHLQMKRLESAGQISLFGDVGPPPDRRTMRKIVEPRLLRMILSFEAYLKSITAVDSMNGFAADHPFEPGEEAYSAGSPARRLAGVMARLIELEPMIDRIVQRHGRGRKRIRDLGAVLPRVQEAASELALFDDEDSRPH